MALDLDRTLIHAAGTPDGLDAVVVEDLNGRPLSVMTAVAAELYRRLCAVCTVVPATTRCLSQYRRVALPHPADWAVAANGGTVLHEGEPDAAWRADLDRRVDATALPDAQRLLDTAALRGRGAIARVRARDGLFISAVLTAPVASALLATTRSELAAIGWRLAPSGRKLYALPAGLDKAAAVAWIAERIGEPVGVAAGDSWLDAGFMRLAGAALCPLGSEVVEVLDPARLWITDHAGPVGTEELLRRALDIVGAAGVTGWPAGNAA